MKRFKINIALIAMLVGVTAAFAFKAPAARQDATVWYRTSNFANRESSNVWVQGSAPVGCSAATKVCSASFEDGYDPNEHDLSDNQSNAEGTITNGYIPN